MPCSGSGSVISNLGGEPKSMTCPWCAGTGERQEGIDAQAGWPSEGQAASAEQGQSVPEASGDEQAASAEQGQSVPEASGDSPSGDSADR